MARKKLTYPLPVAALSHKDKRANIPTEELQSFVADAEMAPKKVLYPRDPSLDPQLVWKGKDEQDSKALEVPAAPIYIQEKIHPQAVIEQVRAETKGKAPAQAELFSDFNGIKFEDLVDFYHHEQNWSNRMILGDSLLVMTSLAEKEGLKGKVQMIYMDPPYGIKFGSNWQVSTRKRDVKDGKAEDLTRQPEQVKAFRDTWQLGIHSYLAYLRDRLRVAHELLTESGSLFVQIGDENVHLVRCILDEVFGSDNFVSLITTKKSGGMGQEFVDNVSDYILWYAREKSTTKYRQLYAEKVLSKGAGARYNQVELEDGTVRPITKEESLRPQLLPNNARVFLGGPLTSETPSPSTVFEFTLEGRKHFPSKGGWKTNREGIQKLIWAGKLFNTKGFVNYKLYFDDFPAVALSNLWDDTMGTAEQNKVYVVQTTSKVIERCLLMTTDPGDLVLDPTCGSGTTAYVAEQWGRRWITLDTSRVALALARTRLMAAKFPYYLLKDSREGERKEAETIGRIPHLNQKFENDIKKEFVYKRVPHVTLKSIANNEEIDAIHARRQAKIETALKELNEMLKKEWQEWQAPREAERGWPDKARKVHEEFRTLRRDRQKEMDASIARRAETELLYDQPYEDSKRVRVAGPFTVESLSPHRVLPGSEQTASETKAKRDDAGGQFAAMILENLRKAGVQTGRKGERLAFESIDSYAGIWIQGAGRYARADGTARRAAISIGPEHGTVGAEQIKEAAKEAVKGTGFDELIICGFAFDAHAGESAKEFTPQSQSSRLNDGASIVAEGRKQYGKLQITLAKMNPDLAMGEELLKSTGAGNLFMVFGEPDIAPLDKKTGRLLPGKDGKYVVELRGVDVYDPTTGQIRNSDAAEDVACWFIDTDYNGESFFVRHAYFTGGGEPYERLKRALRAEIDEAAWSALYSTKSRPFDPPKSGKIAVKVINHFGDEVLKVLEVEGCKSMLR